MAFKTTNTFVPIKEGDAIIFYINKGGFPLMSDAWSQMWQYAKELQPNAIDKLESLQNKLYDLPDIPYHSPPIGQIHDIKITNAEKIEKIHHYIEKLQYNHTGLQFYEIRKDRPLIGLADLAKRIIEDSLPIKCLEAVILSIYLTNEINSVNGLEKFTIGFKTSSKGNIHRHVVLGLYCHDSGLFGALGISRRNDLGYKPLKFNTLSDLMHDYINSYTNYLHRVKRIKIGLPIPCSNRSFESIPWNGCTINLNSMSLSEWPKLVEKHSRILRHHLTFGAQSLKQSTSLSLRNLSNLQGLSTNKNKSKSYLGIHLEEFEKSLGLKKTYSSDFDLDLDSDHDLNPEPKFSSYLPRTAPNQSYSKMRHSSESLGNLSINESSKKNNDATSNLYSSSSSGNLLKRKKKSIRI